MNPLVRKFHYLYPLTAEEEAVLESAFSRVVEYGADEDIVREGDQPTECNVLLEGWTCRYKILEDGKRQIFSFHIAGDIYDAQSFLLETMDHSVCTLTPCRVAVIPHASMAAMTEGHPRIARAIWKDTLIDAAVFREWMASIGRRSAYQRIAHLICEMFVKSEVVGLVEGGRMPWPVTQNEMGDALGLSLVHVNRTLQELRAERLITLKDAMLTVLNWEGLTRAGQFDRGYLHMKPQSLGGRRDSQVAPGQAAESSQASTGPSQPG